MDIDDEDEPPQLIAVDAPASVLDASSKTAAVAADLEELQLKKVPITIVTGMSKIVKSALCNV